MPIDQPLTTNHQPLRIIFMGTPEFAVPALRALMQCSSTRRGEVGRGALDGDSSQLRPHPNPPPNGEGIEIIAVYTQPPRPKGRGQQVQKSPVHQLAEANHIPVYTPTSLKNTEAQAEFAALKADVAVVVAYGLLLPQAILDAPKYGCVNIHPSSLPRWRGAAPIQRSIMAGDKTTEIYIMKMDAGLDTGAVYKRSAPITIPNDMNAGELHDVLAKASAPLLLEVLKDIAAGKAVATPQSADGVTYANKITKEECRIDWRKSAEEIHNHIRGLSPFPGATCLLNGEVLKVYRSSSSPHRGEDRRGALLAEPGTIIPPPQPSPCGGGSIVVACGDGKTLQLLEVQQAGKPRMSAEAFLRGHKVAMGTILG